MRTFKKLPELLVLQEWLEYCPETGVFIWKKSGKGIPGANQIAGTTQENRYSVIRFKGIVYYQHRLAWKMFYKHDPTELYVDHINQIKHDNRIQNLRLVDMSGNCHNKKTISTNKSGYQGVSWNKLANKWCANIYINYKKYFIGYFDDPEVAYEAYLKFKQKTVHHGTASDDVVADLLKSGDRIFRAYDEIVTIVDRGLKSSL